MFCSRFCAQAFLQYSALNTNLTIDLRQTVILIAHLSKFGFNIA